MPQSGIDVHTKQRPTMEMVAKVVGQGYPMGSKEVHRTCHRRTCHRRYQRSPHIDQWFDKSLVFSNGLGGWKVSLICGGLPVVSKFEKPVVLLL